MVVEIYDDYLSNYLKNIKPKGLPANLIKKIMFQLKKVFLGLIGAWGERCINPRNMLIKYTNEKKNNFDVYLSEDGIFEHEKKSFSFYYSHPDIISDIINRDRISAIKDNKIKIKYELFNIGMTLYELYFNEFPFYKESDYQLYQDIFVNNKELEELNYDTIEYPLLKEKQDVRKYNEEKHKELEKVGNFFLRMILYIRESKEEISMTKAFFSEIENRRNCWMKNLSHEIFDKKNSTYDRLLCDLIYKLIEYNKEGSITNYEELFNHPFFNQYYY